MAGRNGTASGTGGGGGGGGVFFAPNIGALADGATLRKSAGGVFDDTNSGGAGPPIVQSVVTRSGGQAKCIRMAYNEDESETLCNVNEATFPIGGTPSIYCRRWEQWDASWDNNWPVAFKTARYFTEGSAYCSEKYISQGYTDWTPPGSRNSPVYGFNHASTNEEWPTAYGTPRIIAGSWHKIETWMTLNSAINVQDGVFQGWIDDVLVTNELRAYRKDAAPTGTGWAYMWFGGNCSFSPGQNGWPFSLTGAVTRYRYIDSPYLSTTLDR